MESPFDQYTQNELMTIIMSELEAIAITDAQSRYIYVNNRWSAITGMTLQSVKGKKVMDVVANSYVETVLGNGKAMTGASTLLDKNGREIPMYCSYTPLYQSGELIGCFCYMIQKNEYSDIGTPPNVTLLFDRLIELIAEYKTGKDAKYSLNNLIGASPKIVKLKEEILAASRSISTVLIEGETGTGKELVAHSIHNISARATAPFVKVNCAAIPSELLESEFFGYEAGTFTGAQKGGKAGKFELAGKGSLFLDEIHLLPMHLQPKFLRVLQEREIERVGSIVSSPMDARIIAASSVPLASLVESGKFRQDLFYRLNVIQIRIPPLRERKSDIPAIADNLLKRLNYRLQLGIPGISDEAKERLSAYDWPGNVRELQNVIERAMNFAWCEMLQWCHFSDYFEKQVSLAGQGSSRDAALTIAQLRDAAEKEMILTALRECKWNKVKAAKFLSLSRTSLYKKMEKHGIE